MAPHGSSGRGRRLAALGTAALVAAGVGTAHAAVAAPPPAETPRVSVYAYGPFPRGASVVLASVADAPGREGTGAGAEPAVRRAFVASGFGPVAPIRPGASGDLPALGRSASADLACDAALTDWERTERSRPRVVAPVPGGAWVDLPPEESVVVRVGVRLTCVRTADGRTVFQGAGSLGPAQGRTRVEALETLVEALLARWREAAGGP
ncbi:hypothetical protein [Deferrisoma sp.]